MIRKILKGVLRAAVAQPWDYMGEGAPNDWEFRVSPDEDTVAVFNPNHGRWVIFRQVVVVEEIARLDEADRRTADWTQFLAVDDPDE